MSTFVATLLLRSGPHRVPHTSAWTPVDDPDLEVSRVFLIRPPACPMSHPLEIRTAGSFRSVLRICCVAILLHACYSASHLWSCISALTPSGQCPDHAVFDFLASLVTHEPSQGFDLILRSHVQGYCVATIIPLCSTSPLVSHLWLCFKTIPSMPYL